MAFRLLARCVLFPVVVFFVPVLATGFETTTARIFVNDDNSEMTTTALPVLVNDFMDVVTPVLIHHDNITGLLEKVVIAREVKQELELNVTVSPAENTIPDEGKKPLHNHELDLWKAPAEITKSFPFYHSGYDEERRPVWIGEFGHYNVRRIIEAGGPLVEALNKYVDQGLHFAARSMEEASLPDNPVDTFVFIADFDKFDIAQITHLPTVQFMIAAIRRQRSFIHKHLHVAIILNANYAAQLLVGIVRPVLGAIMERVEIYGTNKESWQPRLLAKVPKSQLPQWYGGAANFKPVGIYG